jgi:hypothetical protein
VQSAPLHDSEKRLVEPGGVTLSGTCEKPPPIERLPQMSFFNGIVAPRSRNVLPQRPLPAVDVNSKAVTPPVVVEVVLVVGVTVVDVLEVVACSDVELVVGMIDVELVVGMIDVELVVGMIDVELVVGMIDVELVVGMIDVELVVGMIDVELVVGMIDVELVVGTMLVDVDVDGVPTHGFGSHEPGPMSVPSASAHEAGDMIVQVKAPSGEPDARQHRVWAGALVEVLLVVGVDEVLLVVGITDVLLVVGIVELLLVVGAIVEVVVDDVEVLAGHGSGVHEPGPTLMPSSAAHSAGDSTTQTKAPTGVPGKAPSGEPGTQHRVRGRVVVVTVVVDVDVVLVDGVVDVVVDGTHTAFTSVTLSVLTDLAKNAPVRWAPTVISSFALGAQRSAATSALREMRTRVPFAKICTWHGLTADVSGPTLLPLSNLIEPTTRIVTGPRASSWALRCKVRLQNVYVPAVRTSVPGP